MASAHKLQQVVQELGNIGGADIVLEVQFADAASQVDPEIFVVEDTEIFVDSLEHVEAVVVEGGGVHFLAAQQLAHPIAHFVGGVLGVGERKDLVGIGVALSDQPLNALGQDRSLTCACARHYQHGSVDMLDSFALAIVCNEWSGTEVRLRRRHWESGYH